MNFSDVKLLNDQELIHRTERLVEQERQIVQVLIWHLQEIQDRKLFLAMEYTSMYECLIGHFKMSDTTAYSRIKVLKVMEEIPQVSESLKSGELNISSIALAHSFIERHQKTTGEELSQDDKIELMESLKNKTTSEVKELLARCNPETALPYDEVRPLTESHSQMRSTVTKELLEKMEYLKSLLSHEEIYPSHEDLLSKAFDALIEKVEKKKGLHQRKVNSIDSEGPKPTPIFEKPAKQQDHSRYISRDIKRFVFKRAQGRCEHIHASGERCSSRFQTQFDHVIPFSKGGPSTFQNIQLLCRVHNSAKSDG